MEPKLVSPARLSPAPEAKLRPLQRYKGNRCGIVNDPLRIASSRKRSILSVSIAALAGILPSWVAAAELTWDANGAGAPNPYDGGGTWDATNLNWWNGATNVAWSNSATEVAVFGVSPNVPTGIPGNINVSGALTAGGLVFNPYTGNTVKYNITGGTSLTLAGAATITMNTHWARPYAAINTIISGSSGLTVQGSRDSILEFGTQANNYTGTVTLQGSTLSIQSDSGLGAASNGLVFAGNSTLLARASDFTLGSTRGIAINNGVTGTFDVLSSANRLTVEGVISGGGSLRKNGLGTLALSRANTYTGETHIHQGTLLLNFADFAAPASQIIHSSSTLRLSGGTLSVFGGVVANTQTFNGVILDPGQSNITSSSFGSELTINLGAITRNVGSTVNSIPDFSTIVTTSAPNVNGIIGGYATVSNFDWVKVTSGVLDIFTDYQTNGNPAAWVAGDNVSLFSDPTASIGTVTVHSLRTAGQANVNINPGGALTLGSGGLLVTAGPLSISGGTLRGAAGADLIVHQHDDFNPAEISSVIADNGGATALTKTGVGTLVLSGVNTYSGNTFLNAGGLEVNSDAALGAGNTVTARTGSTLRFGGGSAIVSAKNFLFDYGADSYGAAGLNGGPNSPANFTVDVTNTAGVTISGAFNVTAGTMVKSGPGALSLTNPGINNLARLNGGLAFTVSGGTLSFDGGPSSEWRVGQGEFTIGDNTAEPAVVNIRSGTLNVGSWLSIGRGNGTTGVESGLNISGGVLNTGNLYTGYFNNVGGYNARQFINASGNAVINVGDDFRMSESAGSLTAVTLSGTSALKINDRIELGWGGRSVLTINDNATVTASGFGIGHGTNGAGNQGAGAVYQNGGSVSRAGIITGADWRIGGAMGLGNTINTNDAEVWGLYQIAGGTLNTAGQNFQIGANGRGILDIRGTGIVDTNNGSGFPVIGRYAGSFGLLNVGGSGAFKVNSTGQLLIVGEQGSGTVNVRENGTITVLSNPGGGGTGGGTGGIRLGLAANAKGVLNLNGGVVQTTGIAESNTAASSFLYLNGGTIKAGAANATFLQGLDNTVVGSGGAIFDTNGHDITVGQALRAPTGNGLTSIAVSGGEGYLGQPIVEIIGDGSGASAVANVDPVTGQVTSITITNPGINYTTAPTVLLHGGGFTTAAVIGTVAIAPNTTGGGLIKSGAGTLTLAGSNTYSGVTTVNGGSLTVTGSNASGGGVLITPSGILNIGNNGASGSLAGAVTVNGTLNFNRSDNFSYAETLSGSGTINKLNNNTLTLNGAAAFTGALNVNGGTLVASGDYGGAVTINNTARLKPVLGVGTITVGSLTLGNGSATDFEFDAGGNTNDRINVTSATGLSFGTAFTLNFLQASTTLPFSQNGSYLLFDYGTSFTGDLSNLIVGNPVSGKGYSLVNDTGSTSIRLLITDTVVTSWAATGSGLWSGAANWTMGVPDGAGAEAVFGNAITGPASVDIDGAKTVGKVLFGSANPYTINGVGPLNLDNGATAATVAVDQGDHVISTPLNLLVNTSITTAAGSSLRLGDISGAKSLTTGGGGAVVLVGSGSHADTNVTGGVLRVGNGGTTGSLGTGPVTITGGGRVAFNRSDSITIANTITGTGTLAYDGSGTMIFTGSATHSGATDLNSGTFINEGTINGTTRFDVDNNTTLRANSNTTITGPSVIAASSTATLNIQGSANAAFNGALNVGAGFGTVGTLNINTTGTVTSSGNIAIGEGIGSNGALTIAGGTITQTGGTNIFIGHGGAGTFQMTGGTLQVGTGGLKFADAAVGSGAEGNGTISGGTITTGGEIWFANNAGNSSTVTISGGNVSASNWIAIGRLGGIGAVTLSSGSLNKTVGGGSIVIGSLSGVGQLTQSGTGTLTTANDLLIGENSGVNRSDGSKWEMSGGNATIGGVLNVAWRSATSEFKLTGGTVSAGRLAVGSETNNPDAGPANGTVSITGGALTIGSSGDSRIGGDQANNPTSEGTVNIQGGTMSVAGNFQVGAYGIGRLNMSSGSLTTGNWTALGRFAGSSGTLNLSGGTLTQTNDSAGFIVAEDGTAVLNLSETGTLDVRNLRVGLTAAANGTVNLNGGTLATKYVQKFAGTGAFKFNGGILKANDNSEDFIIGFQDSDLSVLAGGARFDSNGFNVKVSPGLSGVGGLTKQGAGVLNLAGFNTYEGPTSVTGGSLLVSGSINGTASVNVASGATLGGGGSIVTTSNGSVILSNGASLDPGTSVSRTLTMLLGGGGLLDLSATAGGNGYLRFGLGEFENDALSLQTGVLNLGTGLDLDDFTFSNLGNFGVGTYVLFDTGSSIVGTLGTNLTGNLFGFQATLGFSGGVSGREDLVLTVVPEPSAALALLAGGSLLLGVRRRRNC